MYVKSTPQRRSILTLLLLISFALLSAGLRGEEPGIYLQGHTFLEVLASYNHFSASQPWTHESIENEKNIGIYLDDRTVLVGNVRYKEAASFLIKEKRIDRDYTASLIHRDRELKLALIRMDHKSLQGDDDDTRDDRIEKRMRPVSLETDPGTLRKGAGLSVLSLSEKGTFYVNTVFFAGLGSGRYDDTHTLMPAILFSSVSGRVSPGDPLLNNGKLLGIVMQYDSTDRVGRALPAIFLRRFLEQSRQSYLEKKRSLKIIDVGVAKKIDDTIAMDPGFLYTPLKPRSVRMYYGLKSDTNGALVTEVFPHGAASHELNPDDVILEYNGHAVLSDGTVALKEWGRLPLSVAMTLDEKGVASGATLHRLKVARGTVIRNVQFHGAPFSPADYRVPPHSGAPPYAIVGGGVFLELSGDYLGENPGAPARLHYLAEARQFRDDSPVTRYVILDRILPLKGNNGYDDRRELVLSVNGIAVRNLSHMYSLVKDAREHGQTVVIQLEGNRKLIWKPETLLTMERELLDQKGIPFLTGRLEGGDWGFTE